MRNPVLLPLVLLTAAAAAAVPARGQAPLSRDSAGVRIANSQVASSNIRFQVDARPQLVIGGASGAGPYELWRVAGVHRTDLGDTFASVSGAHQVRKFDTAGAYVAGYGRAGAGPREFHAMASMELYALADGRLAVDDRFNGRIHMIDAALGGSELLRLRSLPGLVAGAPRGVFADGYWLAVAPANGGRTVENGRLRHFVLSYHKVVPEWTDSHELIRVRSGPRAAVSAGGRQRIVRVPFTVEPLVVTTGTGILLSENGAAEIRGHDARGTLRTIHRWSPPRRETRDHWRRYQRHQIDSAEPGRRQLLAQIHASDLPLPSDLPAIQNLIVANDGMIWAERYRLPWETSSTWDVLASDGSWLTTVDMPSNLEVRQIGRDFVAGIERDAFDIESLVVYRLRRTPDPAQLPRRVPSALQ